MYIKINGPSLEEVEDIFRSLTLIGHQTVRRSPLGQISVVAGQLGLADTPESPDCMEEEVLGVGPVCPLI